MQYPKQQQLQPRQTGAMHGWQQQGIPQGQRSPASAPQTFMQGGQAMPYPSGQSGGGVPPAAGSPAHAGGFMGGSGGVPSPSSNPNSVAATPVGASPVPSPAAGRAGTPGNAAVAPTSGQPTAAQPAQPFNLSVVCRIGQETVQEIQWRTQEIFSYLKGLQVPVGSHDKDRQNFDKKHRLQEVLNGITVLFKRLNYCYTKVQEHTGDVDGDAGAMDYTNIESLIPLKGREDLRLELEKKRGDVYRKDLEEHAELTNQLMAKNRKLKKIIDDMRVLIWEINTMLAMR